MNKERIEILSTYDATEAVSRMKIQPIKEYTADAYEFSEFTDRGEAPAAILIVGPISLATSGQKFNRLLNCARRSVIILFVPDFLEIVAKKLEYWSSFVDVFVVPTPEAQKLMKAYTAKAVRVLLDPIDFELQNSSLCVHENKAKLTVGWFGYPESYKKSMSQYEDVLKDMHVKNEIEYRIITDCEKFEHDTLCANPGYKLIKYKAHDFLHDLCSLDICVVSHAPFDFSMSTYLKSENKALLAINRGVPTIATTTPAYERLLNSCGLGQYLFSSKEELRSAINALSDATARNAYLAASQEFVLENFNCKKMVSNWLSILDEARQLKQESLLGSEPTEIKATPVADNDFNASRQSSPDDADAQTVALSVVICTRNRADQLANALNRWAELTPKSSWELIIVDNGSTDATPQIVAEAQKRIPALRYALEPRIGLGAGRDRGWRETRGEIVALTDDDCYPSSSYVDDYVEAFRRSPDLGYMGGRILLWDEDDVRLTVDYREEAEEIAPYRFIPAGTLHGANFAFRRETLEKIGGVDPELGAGTPFPCEDIDLVAAAAWAGYKGKFDPTPLVYHHHGRKAGDWDRTMRSYDKGRGTYYAKYILRKDSRQAYLRGWARSVLSSMRRAIALRNRGKFLTPVFELCGAGRYLIRFRPWKNSASH